MALENTIAMIAAGVGVVATIIYILLGVKGVKTLSDIRDTLQNSGG
jgi:hypothetical protein